MPYSDVQSLNILGANSPHCYGILFVYDYPVHKVNIPIRLYPPDQVFTTVLRALSSVG